MNIVNSEEISSDFDILLELFSNFNISISIFAVINNGKSSKDYILVKSNNPDTFIKTGGNLQDIYPIYYMNDLIDLLYKAWSTGTCTVAREIKYTYDNQIRYFDYKIHRLSSDTVCICSFDVTDKVINREKFEYAEKSFINAETLLLQSKWQYNDLLRKMMNGFALCSIICNENNIPVDYCFIEVNPAFEKMVSRKASELIGKNASKLFLHERFLIKNFGEVALTGKNLEIDYHSRILDKYFTIFAHCPEKGQFAIIITDNTARKQMEHEIYAEKEQLKTTLTSIGDGVITTNKYGEVELLNTVSEELTGWKNEEAFGKPLIEVFDIFNEVSGEKCESPVDKVLKTGKVIGLANHTALKSKDGTIRSIADSAAPIRDEKGKILGVVLVFRDVTEEKNRNKRIAYLSSHDTLTGLYNRSYIEDEMIKADVPVNYPISIIMGDVNGLKITNDIFGHREGDILLKAISKVLKLCCRSDHIIARWAGDEFVILMPKTSLKEANLIAEKIYSACQKYGCKELRLSAPPSISLGCAAKTQQDQSIPQIVKAAEDFMYKRKLLEKRSVHSSIIVSMKKTLVEKDRETEEHASRLYDHCLQIANELDMSSNELNDLELFAMLHDIGKIAISENILLKPGKLTDTEWDEMKRHPEIGYRIAMSSPELQSIAGFILTHHEKWDGSGYPYGLKGTNIPILSRILAVVDAYDAMTHDRPYRKSMSKEKAISELKEGSGIQFDPSIVEIFIKKIK